MTVLSTFSIALAASGLVQGTALRRGTAIMGTTTRYWDCCKPGCGWNDKAPFSAPVKVCDINDNSLSNGGNLQSGCLDGPAYMCSDQIPYAKSSSLAYGFAATHGASERDGCCACYLLTFTKDSPLYGKQMVVQSTNTGNDVGQTQFDLAIPGGGVGQFPQGCQKEYNAPNSEGHRGWGSSNGGSGYGGVATREECNELPATPQNMRAGCLFRFDWMNGADNPKMEFERVSCPAELIAKTGCKRNDDEQYPAVGGGDAPPSPPPSSSTSTTTTTTVNPSGPTQTAHGQCGGSGYNGPTQCPPGFSCKQQNGNIYYSQCVASSGAGGGNAPPSSSVTTPPPAQQTKYGQCGGKGYTGPTQCPAGSTCQQQQGNEYYYQCV